MIDVSHGNSGKQHRAADRRRARRGRADRRGRAAHLRRDDREPPRGRPAGPGARRAAAAAASRSPTRASAGSRRCRCCAGSGGAVPRAATRLTTARRLCRPPLEPAQAGPVAACRQINAPAPRRSQTGRNELQELRMKVLLAVDGSDYTKRMLAYLAAHPDLLGKEPEITVYHGLMALPHHAASVVGPAQVRAYQESELEKVFKPIRRVLRPERRPGDLRRSRRAGGRRHRRLRRRRQVRPGRHGVARPRRARRAGDGFGGHAGARTLQGAGAAHTLKRHGQRLRPFTLELGADPQHVGDQRLGMLHRAARPDRSTAARASRPPTRVVLGMLRFSRVRRRCRRWLNARGRRRPARRSGSSRSRASARAAARGGMARASAAIQRAMSLWRRTRARMPSAPISRSSDHTTTPRLRRAELDAVVVVRHAEVVHRVLDAPAAPASGASMLPSR